MTKEEAHKINDMYKQIDVLTAENNGLKATGSDLVAKLNLSRLRSTSY